jgi:hypothetical protein
MAWPPAWLAVAAVLCLGSVGCGTTKQTLATDQLLESDAVDAAIAAIDFAPLAGQKVFFETKYLQDYKGVGFVNSNYIISSLRQQIISAGCKLEDTAAEATYVVEGRIGALGSDRHELVYGIPQSNVVSSVGSLVPGAPPIPPIPELSVARKADSHGAAKIALFAFHRESGARVWQSGTSTARSESKDTWLMGIGPIQRGTIYRGGARFAGSRLPWQFWKKSEPRVREGALHAYQNSALYQDPRMPAKPAGDILMAVQQPDPPATEPSVIQQAAAEIIADDPPSASTTTADAPESTVTEASASDAPAQQPPPVDVTHPRPMPATPPEPVAATPPEPVAATPAPTPQEETQPSSAK